ncbi:MAG: peptide chain release factor N(5)-glutamine methyltransferase [Clostridia bacterium]|jgi:release factor-specific protein-(glutamine-N5) methyltransferase|nr:peptide chain release factor N(5)-glutamine methyltransferase [Clostridia bacterium]
MARKNTSKIGGQAVLEGVMMRGERSMATAVRDEKGNVVVESRYVTPTSERSAVYRIPFVRGVFNFFGSMAMGMKTLMRSGEVFDDDTQPGKLEKWMAKKLKINIYDVMMVFSVILGVALAIGLFFFLPLGVLTGIKALVTKYVSAEANELWYVTVLYALLEGLLRIIIFVVYIALTTLMKPIKRTYMYHGAEHKTISCYEHGLELTVENAQKMTTVHDRCGTTFMFIVMLVSVVIFSIVGIFEPYMKGLGAWKNVILFASRIVLLPIVMGISYEMLKTMAKYDNVLVRILKWPGLMLQKLTTKQPDDSMVECAIIAFNTVMAMDADPSIPEKRFDTKKPYEKVRDEIKTMLKGVDESDIDWIFCEVCNVKRSQLAQLTHVRQLEYERAVEFAKKRQKGEPLWRVFGKADFYGYDIVLTPDVLCPRPETEYLAQEAIELLSADSKVLDMCTGSGCIAIAIAGKSGAEVTACDISEKALEVAKQNAVGNNVADKITFVKSDMFECVEGRYDVIVSNPPYIPTKDIAKLDKEVREYDPKIALDGGDDGLDFYRIFAKDASKYLCDGGHILLEVGIDQAQAVESMFEGYDSRIIKDLQGIDRIVLLTKLQESE